MLHSPRMVPKVVRLEFSHNSPALSSLEIVTRKGHPGPAMLPMTFQFIIAMIAYAINERMARRIDYLHEEVRVPREGLAAATGKTRTAFTPEQRRRLAIKGKALTPEERESVLSTHSP